MSGDGRLLAFGSLATNLVTGGCASGVRQVYVGDPLAGTTECVSVDPGGAPGNGQSLKPALNADGRFVAFQSTAPNLAAGCQSGVQQILVYDRVSGTATCESVGPGGVAGSGPSSAPVLSATGSRLAFLSAAPNLASPCTTGAVQAFVRDRGTGVTRCASLGPGGVPGNGDVGAVALSGNGRVLAFASGATNLVKAGAALPGDVRRADLRGRPGRAGERGGAQLLAPPGDQPVLGRGAGERHEHEPGAELRRRGDGLPVAGAEPGGERHERDGRHLSERGGPAADDRLADHGHRAALAGGDAGDVRVDGGGGGGAVRAGVHGAEPEVREPERYGAGSGQRLRRGGGGRRCCRGRACRRCWGPRSRRAATSSG